MKSFHPCKFISLRLDLLDTFYYYKHEKRKDPIGYFEMKNCGLNFPNQ